MQPQAAVESKRISRFKQEIIQSIPRFLNAKETLLQLEAKGLGDLLITYANFISRRVPPRPRAISIQPAVVNDKRWKNLSGNINALLDRARAGDDLNPYLSLKAHKEGYTPVATGTGPDVNIWADKDMLLNVMCYHHFHLTLDLEKSGISKRTDNVLFAALTRDAFTAIGIFDHSVFETKLVPSQTMAAERERLWGLYELHCQHNRPPGTIYISSAITTAGTTIGHSMLSMQYARTIREIDPKLDDPEFLEQLVKPKDEFELPKHKLEWAFLYLDLGIYDKTSGIFHILHKGPT